MFFFSFIILSRSLTQSFGYLDSPPTFRKTHNAKRHTHSLSQQEGMAIKWFWLTCSLSKHENCNALRKQRLATKSFHKFVVLIYCMRSVCSLAQFLGSGSGIPTKLMEICMATLWILNWILVPISYNFILSTYTLTHPVIHFLLLLWLLSSSSSSSSLSKYSLVLTVQSAI